MIASTAHSTTTNEILFKNIGIGNEAAFSEIFYQYSPRIFHFVLVKTKSETITEEIVQDVFMKIWEKREYFASIENHEAYIYSMATNRVYDWFRKMANDDKLKRQTLERINALSNITEETIDFNASLSSINEAVAMLSPQRKKIFLMSRNEGLSRAAIAKELNLSVNTVNNHLNEALSFLKKHLRNNAEVSISLILIYLTITMD